MLGFECSLYGLDYYKPYYYFQMNWHKLMNRGKVSASFSGIQAWHCEPKVGKDNFFVFQVQRVRALASFPYFLTFPLRRFFSPRPLRRAPRGCTDYLVIPETLGSRIMTLLEEEDRIYLRLCMRLLKPTTTSAKIHTATLEKYYDIFSFMGFCLSCFDNIAATRPSS